MKFDIESMEIFINNEKIREEYVYRFWECLAEKNEGTENEIETEIIRSIYNKLEEFLAYEYEEGASVRNEFLRGAVWGTLGFYLALKSKQKKESNIFDLMLKYKNRNRVIEVIRQLYKKPGLQNKELSTAIEVSTARISQLVEELMEDKLISAMTLGKLKYYYLTSTGKKLYNELGYEKSINSFDVSEFGINNGYLFGDDIFRENILINEKISFSNYVNKHFNDKKLFSNNRDENDLDGGMAWDPENDALTKSGNSWKQQKENPMIRQLQYM